MAGQTRIDGNLIDTGTDPNDIVSVSVGDGRYPRLSQDNTLAGNLTVDGQVRSDNVTDSAGTGAPAFPNGMSVTGAALTDPEITGGIYLGGTGTANKLDDYETGTFTTVFTTTGTDFSSDGNTASGTYTKVGNVVTVTASAFMSGGVSGGTGQVVITGLPFAASTSSYGSFRCGRITLAADDYLSAIFGNTAELVIEYLNSGSLRTILPASDVNGNASPFLTATVSYFTNS